MYFKEDTRQWIRSWTGDGKAVRMRARHDCWLRKPGSNTCVPEKAVAKAITGVSDSVCVLVSDLAAGPLWLQVPSRWLSRRAAKYFLSNGEPGYMSAWSFALSHRKKAIWLPTPESAKRRPFACPLREGSQAATVAAVCLEAPHTKTSSDCT